MRYARPEGALYRCMLIGAYACAPRHALLSVLRGCTHLGGSCLLQACVLIGMGCARLKGASLWCALCSIKRCVSQRASSYTSELLVPGWHALAGDVCFPEDGMRLFGRCALCGTKRRASRRAPLIALLDCVPGRCMLAGDVYASENEMCLFSGCALSNACFVAPTSVLFGVRF